MLEAIAAFVVHRPLNILALAVIPLAAWALSRFAGALSLPRPDWLLAPALGLALYAAWEWVVMIRSPEADIRFDILLIWLVLLALTIGSVVKAAR